MANRRVAGLAVLLCTALAVAGCMTQSAAPAAMQKQLVVYCPHPQSFINPIVSEFEASTGIDVEVHSGGTGKLLRMLEEQQEPLCDVVWGGSLSTVLPMEALFADYRSANEDAVQPEFGNTEGSLTRFTDIPSVLMVNRNLTGGLQITGYADLLQPVLRGSIAMCDPASSSSAQEHLVNMLYAMGKGDPEQGWGYVEAFCANLDGKLLASSSEVYRGVAEGRFAVGLTFEEAAANYAANGDPVDIVYMAEGVISIPDVVCISKTAPHPEEARAFVDFVTGRDAQTVVASKLNRRSVRTDVEEPGQLPDKSRIAIIYSDKDEVTAHKETWLARFADIFAAAQGRAAP